MPVTTVYQTHWSMLLLNFEQLARASLSQQRALQRYGPWLGTIAAETRLLLKVQTRRCYFQQFPYLYQR